MLKGTCYGLTLALLLVTACVQPSHAYDNWAEHQVPRMVDAFLKKMDPTLLTMEAQITAMDTLSKKERKNYQEIFNALILYKTISLAADSVDSLAPTSRSSEVSGKMELVSSIAEAHYSETFRKLEAFVDWLEPQRAKFASTEKGRAALVDFDTVKAMMPHLDKDIAKAFNASQYKPTRFREM